MLHFPNIMTDFSFFLSFLPSVWCSSFVSSLYCYVLLLLCFVVWLRSSVALSLFISLVILTRVLLIFCCMFERSVYFIKTTSSKPLWVFTTKLCFTFFWRWTLFASVSWVIENGCAWFLGRKEFVTLVFSVSSCLKKIFSLLSDSI